MRSENETPKPYHHGDLRATLLRVTGELIREKGIEGLAMRECARRAGVSWSAPIHHFKDKRGLLTAFAVQGFEWLTASILAQSKDVEDVFLRSAAVGMAYLEFALANPEHFRMMYRAELLNAQDSEYVATRTAATGLFEGAMRACDAALGRVNDPTLPERMLLAWSVVHGFATLCLEGAIPPPDESDLLELGKRLIMLSGDSLFGDLPVH
jgi:AcrR family transcriptional regulator